MKICNLCPVQCGVDRSVQLGRCGVKGITVSKAYLHPYEEPILSPNGKSGAIFFGGCSLRCSFCQNYELSHAMRGKPITPKQLTILFRRLEDAGAENIDLVTPDHISDLIGEALSVYKPKIPVIYNTSGYCLQSSLEAIDPYIDIWLTDVKFCSPLLAMRYTGRKDYLVYAASCLHFMKQKPIVYDGDRMLSGMVVRHLVMPSCTTDSIAILHLLDVVLPRNVPLSIMRQFTPNLGETDLPELRRRVTDREYKRVADYAMTLGFERLYLQDKSSAKASFVPTWDD